MLSSQCGLAGMKEDSPAATEAEVHVRACNSYSTTCCPSSVSRPTKTLRESHTLLSLISQLIVTVKCHANRVDEGKKNKFISSLQLSLFLTRLVASLGANHHNFFQFCTISLSKVQDWWIGYRLFD